MLKLGILASGRGSNFAAIHAACASGAIDARVVALVSDRPAAGCLALANEAGIPAEVIDPRAYASRDDFDTAVAERLLAHEVELVCLAGYMRLISPAFLRRFPDRVLNIHPALLPSFPGLHGPRQALAAGVRVAGCTVHFVDEGLDSGPILMQAAVPVLPGDTEETLASRILVEEHRIYPASIDLIARRRVRLEGRRVVFVGTEP